jgi:hypothetical protein
MRIKHKGRFRLLHVDSSKAPRGRSQEDVRSWRLSVCKLTFMIFVEKGIKLSTRRILREHLSGTAKQ